HSPACHFTLAGGPESFTRPIAALDPVASDFTGPSAGAAERRNAAVIGKHHGGHRLEEAHPPLAAVAAPMPAGAAAASPDAIRVEAYGKAPLEHFGIGEPRIRHVRLDHARAVEVRPRAGTAGDRLVVLVALVAEGEIVHRALRGGERAQRAVER